VQIGVDLSRQATRHQADVVFLHGIASRMAEEMPFDQVLNEVVDLATSLVACDSCFVYVLEGDELVLRASKNSHPEALGKLKLKLGQGITGWVAQHSQPVVVARNAALDTRFQFFNELPEDRFQAFLSVPLLSRGLVVGVINLQNVAPHNYSEREITLASTVGFLVGAKIEMVRLEQEKVQLADRLELRKLIERAKGILQHELKISEQEAYLMLQRQSQQRRKPMKDIAEAVTLSRGQTKLVISERDATSPRAAAQDGLGDSNDKKFEFDFVSTSKQDSASRWICVAKVVPSFRRREEAILWHDAVPIQQK
jgi:uroporphyrinogen-III synthase